MGEKFFNALFPNAAPKEEWNERELENFYDALLRGDLRGHKIEPGQWECGCGFIREKTDTYCKWCKIDNPMNY